MGSSQGVSVRIQRHERRGDSRWLTSDQQSEEDYTRAPNVYRLSVVRFLAVQLRRRRIRSMRRGLKPTNLWRGVGQSAAAVVQLPCLVLEAIDRAKSEVRYLQVSRRREQDILWLKVAMYHADRMDVQLPNSDGRTDGERIRRRTKPSMSCLKYAWATSLATPTSGTNERQPRFHRRAHNCAPILSKRSPPRANSINM